MRLLALLAVVVVLHLAALRWLSQQLDLNTVLSSLPTPMFTRLLQQEAPVDLPVAKASFAPQPKPRSVATRSIAAANALPARSPASDPPPAPPAPVAPPSPTVAAPDIPAAPPAVAREPQEPVVAAKPPQPAASQASGIGPVSTTAAPNPDASIGSWPADTRLTYRLGGQYRSGELHGDARVQWQRDGDRYQTRISIDVTLLAALVLTSQGEVTPGGLYPRVYEEIRRSSPRSAKLGDNTIALNDGRTVPRPLGVQDTASQFVELSHRFATGQEKLEVGRSVSLWLARPGGVDLWIYDIVGREMLQAQGLGAIEAFHLKPRPLVNPRGNITAEMWFAPSLQYLPVRIRVNLDEATFVDLMVEKIEQR